jgi:hypothetical protein
LGDDERPEDTGAAGPRGTAVVRGDRDPGRVRGGDLRSRPAAETDGRDDDPGGGAERPRRAPKPTRGGINIGAGENLAILGQGRSGKTTLTKQLLPAIASYVIVDTKQVREDFADERWGVISADPAAILYHARVVWQVDLHSKKGLRDYERGLQYVYESRGDPGGRPSVVLLLDEAKHSAPTEPAPLLARIVFSGMGRGIATWAGTQTRYKVYPNLFSDAFHVISFRVQSGRDRGAVEGDIGVPCGPLLSLGDHEWMYWTQGATAWSGPHKCAP